MKIRPQPADWAVLIYSSAPANIEEMAVASLREVAEAEQPDSVVVGAQFGRPDRVERFRFEPGVTDELNRPLERLRVDMADPASLEDFLRWGLEKFPARHYMVVLGGHSAGFVGAVTDGGQRKLMPLWGVAGAFARSGLKPEVLAFNSCLMAQVESAMEFIPRADYLVASEGEELAEGMPLGEVIEQLGGCRDGACASQLLIERSSGSPGRTPTMTAVKLDLLQAVAEPLDRLGQAILEAPEALPALRTQVERTVPFWQQGSPLSDYRDLGAVLGSWGEDPRLPISIRKEAQQALEAAQSAVVGHHSAREQPQEMGLSLYLPTEPLPEGLRERVEPIYRGLELSRNTRWDEAVELLSSPKNAHR